MTIRPAYARFYASTWRSGTLMLSLEEEGLYIRVSAYQMECGQPVPSDWKAGARLLCVQPLKYRKTIDSLIAKGKLKATENGIICERAMKEFRRASNGVQGPATNPDTNPHTNPDTNRGTMGVEAKKDQQNQDQNRNRREEEEKKEEIEQPAPTEQSAAGGPGSEVFGLNGSTTEIIGGIAKLLNVYAPDHETAKRIVASNVGLFGAQAVRDGYAELMADMADNKVIVPRIKTLVGYFKQAGDKRAKAAVPKGAVAGKKTLREVMEERAASGVVQ